MPKFATSQEWLDQSALLFKAYPTSSRITTKYKILPPPSEDRIKKRKRIQTESQDQSAPAITTHNASFQPRAIISLKTYDPVSGVCLKYQTDKEREVGRLIASLGRLGRHMAALPDVDIARPGPATTTNDVIMIDEKELPDRSATTSAAATQQAQPLGNNGGSGGGKKKKKGRK